MLTRLLLLLGAAFLGSFLAIRGVRGRYVGGEPRCRRCAYQLTGIDSGRCPECGLELTHRTIVRGVRRRRWVSLIAGLLILVICVRTEELIYYVKRLPWVQNRYQYYPFYNILRAVKANQLEALDELERRLSEGLLSGAQQYAVGEAALEKDKENLDYWVARHWQNIVRALDTKGALTKEQRERIFSRFAKASMRVRPVIRQGDPLIVGIHYESDRSVIFGGSYHRGHYYFWDQSTELRVGGQAIQVADREGWRKRSPDWLRSDYFPVENKVMFFETDELPVGHWTVEYVGRHIFAHMAIYRMRRPPYPDTVPSWSADIRLTGEVEILPPHAQDPVEWVVDPSIKDEVLGAFDVRPSGPCDGSEDRFSTVCLWKREGQDDLRCSLDFSGGTSVPVAFELVIQAGGRELPTQTFDTRGHRTRRTVLAWDEYEPDWVATSAAVPPFEEDEIYVILRASRDVARQTVDLFEIWKGELRFGPFKVEHYNSEEETDVDNP